MVKELDDFYLERDKNTNAISLDKSLSKDANTFMQNSGKYKYTYNFDWLGRPIIQFPQDIVVLQELFFKVKPTLYIETGIAHGGSSIFAASMMSLLDIYEGLTDIRDSKRKVISIDIDIKSHNKTLISDHPFSRYINLIEGSSTSSETVDQVKEIYNQLDSPTVMVSLDSNHTADHVYQELSLYANLVTLNSYCIVWDTSIEFDEDAVHSQRPWGAGNSPLTAINQWIPDNSSFKIDHKISDKLLITVAPSGFLKRVSY